LLEEARTALRRSTEEILKVMREFRGWKAGNLGRFGRDVRAIKETYKNMYHMHYSL